MKETQNNRRGRRRMERAWRRNPKKESPESRESAVSGTLESSGRRKTKRPLDVGKARS